MKDGLFNERLIKNSQFKGYEYHVKKNLSLGILNGYVLIKPKQAGYNLPNQENSDYPIIQCHGGITWDNSYCNNRIIGFDTAHALDYVPTGEAAYTAMTGFKGAFPLHHWTVNEVANECKNIINQLRRLDNEKVH